MLRKYKLCVRVCVELNKKFEMFFLLLFFVTASLMQFHGLPLITLRKMYLKVLTLFQTFLFKKGENLFPFFFFLAADTFR